MQTDVIELADQLQKEAKILLNEKQLWHTFLQNGKIHIAGSTYLDLLVFPDLDVYFETTDTINILNIFSDTARNLIIIDKVRSIEFEKDLYKRYPKQVPEGLFLQYRIDNGSRLWKIDIWAIKNKNILNTKMKESADFKNRMTPDQRKLILQAKYKLMFPFGRTPIGSSYLVYRAVLEKGLNTVDKILSFIKEQGGNIDTLK